MNRCIVCDHTDEGNSQGDRRNIFQKLSITMHNGEPMCNVCQEAIKDNLEDLSVNDDVENYSYPIEQDGDWFEAPLPEVSEQ